MASKLYEDGPSALAGVLFDGMTIAAGSNEIQRNIIAKMTLGL